MIPLRTPKGTRDYDHRECFYLNKLLCAITQIFEIHGAVNVETPTFELREVLCNKYGEESKLIFDLADQGGDLCSLRYDLTVSFARFLAKNKIQRIKRFQIGKVFRRDQPSIIKGRLREFLQCDFDIAGSYLDMVADAEIICVLSECLDNIGPKYRIRINHRLVLDALVRLSGVNSKDFVSVCSSIDKLGKVPWVDVGKELCMKGINWDIIEEIERYVRINGNREVFEVLKSSELYSDEKGRKGIDDLESLLRYLEIYGVASRILIDLSLARGLDYYTGVIFEASFVEFEDIGSIAGGGRYDNLVSSFLNRQEKQADNVPCVGFSLGITRMLPILTKDKSESGMSKVKVFVGSSGSLLLEERLKILRLLWKSRISAETFYTKKYNFNGLLSTAKRLNIPFFLVVGEKEISEGKLKLLYGRDISLQFSGNVDEIIEFIKSST